MKWERKESHLSPATTQFKAEGLQPPVWKRSQVVQAEAVGLEPTTVLPAAVFKTVSSSGRVTSERRRSLRERIV